MIGKVLFAIHGRDAVATLGDDGRWTVEIPGAGDEAGWKQTIEVLADDLNTNHPAVRHSPADGHRGYRQLGEAAEEYGGRVEAPEPGPGEPGTVY